MINFNGHNLIYHYDAQYKYTAICIKCGLYYFCNSEESEKELMDYIENDKYGPLLNIVRYSCEEIIMQKVLG